MSPKSRPSGLDSPITKSVIKVMSRANTRLYRLTGGRMGGTWRVGSAMRTGVPICLLTTTGRRSGEARTAPLLYLRDGENIVLVASQGGLPSHPQWYFNVKADPAVRIQIGSRTTEMTASIADEAQRETLWPRLLELYPDFADYQSWTTREIPVVICSPA